MTLGKARDCLVDYCLVDTCGNILFPCALVQKGLDISLCENTAAGRNGINLVGIHGKFVHLVTGDVH